MRKLHTLKYAVLAVILSVTATNHAQAFLFFPPMPPEPVVDAPDIVGKTLSNVQAVVRKGLTIKTELSTGKLNFIKGGLNKLGIDPKQLLKTALGGAGKSKSTKAPGKGQVKSSTKLNLGSSKEDLVNEEKYATAYRQLFLTEPSAEDYKNAFKTGDNTDVLSAQDVVNRAYRNKRIAYQQDRIIDTYIYARLMEEYLGLVEKTVERMGPCINNDKDENECIFFGLQMKKMESSQSAPEEGQASAGEIGQVKNAYVVSVLYDRLVRIVEDLTAQEAIFRASEQLDVTEPTPAVSSGNHSSAEQYIDNHYRFAYTDSYIHTAARRVINCYGENAAQEGCPGFSREAENNGEENPNPILMSHFDQIEHQLDKVLSIHNLKVQLPSYKTEYRQYLKAQEIHARALQGLKDSDTCVLNFLKLYGDSKVTKTKDWSSFWGNKGVAANDYDHRTGVSRELIQAYDDISENTIIGTSPLCENYYSVCKDGYRLDTDNPCEDDPSLFPCVLDTIGMSNTGEIDVEPVVDENGDERTPGDVRTFSDILESDIDDEENEEEIENNKLLAGISFDTADLLKNASQEDDLDRENRIQTEQIWHIGADKITQLTEDGLLKFAPWNDQQAMQEEYLYHKYNNIKKIILSTDKATNGYKVAQDLVNNRSSAADADALKDISNLLNRLQVCPGADSPYVAQKAEEEYAAWKRGIEANFTSMKNSNPTKYKNFTCTQLKYHKANTDKGTRKFTGECSYYRYKNGDWDKKTPDGYKYNKTYTQIAIDTNGSPNCYFTKTPNPQQLSVGSKDYCKPGETWDLTLNFLVKGFFNVLGHCASDPDDAAKNLYQDSKNSGRVIAQDVLLDVVNTRNLTEQELINFVKKYDEEQTARRELLKRYKVSINAYNKAIDEATSKQNKVKDELRLTNRRIKTIGDSEKPASGTEIAIINQRIAERSDDAEFVCALSIEKERLIFEREAISGTEAENLKWSLPKECKGLNAEKQFDETNVPQRENYVISMSDFKGTYIQVYTDGLSKWVKKEAYTTVDDRRIVPSDAEKEIDTLAKIIQRNDAARKNIKKKIDDLTQLIIYKAEEFTDTYLDKAEENQAVIEKVNNVYEEFFNHDWRMRHSSYKKCTKKVLGVCVSRKNKTYYDDTLAGTVAAFNEKGNYKIDYDDASDYNKEVVPELKEVAKKVMEDKFINNTIINAMVRELSNQFGLDGTMLIKAENISILGKTISGPYSAQKLVDFIKDRLIEKAADEVSDKIQQADEAINKEVTSAINKVSAVAISLGVADNMVPNSIIYKHENYGSDSATIGLITQKHMKLLANLRQPASPYFQNHNIDMSSIFGIPSDGDLIKIIGTVQPNNNVIDSTGKKIGKADPNTKLAYNSKGAIMGNVDGDKVYNLKEDEEYFVGLPARGNNYLGKKDNDDENAGRDYMFPKRPLLNLPPVREVFYYSPADYDDTPKTKRKKKAKYFMPSMSYLLNKKYPQDEAHQWEYMPEVWRYLLASPNMRKDGKYQQTFVERTMAGSALKKLIDNIDNKRIPNAKNENYRTIIGRGGVYPCRIGVTIYDMGMSKSKDDVRKMEYKIRDLPENYVIKNIPTCREIGQNKGGTTVCTLYNSNKKGICHLRADHGRYKDIQEKTPTTKEAMYDRYSELGQFLQGTLEYRPMQQKIHEYLLSTDKDAIPNNIARQRAEQAVFKRNLFGSFLENVQTEYLTRKNVEKLSESINDRLKSICEQYHEVLGENISGSETEAENDYKECITYIRKKSGLASSAEDRKYGTDAEYKIKKKKKKKKNTQEYNFGGMNCSEVLANSNNSGNYYDHLYCKLAEKRQELLNEIMTKGIEYKTYEYSEVEHKMIEKTRRTKPFNTYKSEKLTGVLKERFKFLENYIALFEADKNIEVYLTTEIDKGEMPDKIKNAKTDRIAERISDEEGIIAMDNQGHVVTYCPTYAYKKKEE